MEENVVDFERAAYLEAGAFSEDVPAKVLIAAIESEKVIVKNTIKEFDVVEGIPILPVNGQEYVGFPRKAAAYLIDIKDPAWYIIEVKAVHVTDLIHGRLIIFMENSLNTPIVDGGFYNTGIQEFLYPTRYRVVIHNVVEDYTISVSKVK